MSNRSSYFVTTKIRWQKSHNNNYIPTNKHRREHNITVSLTQNKIVIMTELVTGNHIHLSYDREAKVSLCILNNHIIIIILFLMTEADLISNLEVNERINSHSYLYYSNYIV